MVKVEDDEPRAPVEGGCGNIVGRGVVDGDGGEENHVVEIAGDATVNGIIAGSVAGEGEFSAEKVAQEARYELCLQLLLISDLFIYSPFWCWFKLILVMEMVWKCMD